MFALSRVSNYSTFSGRKNLIFNNIILKKKIDLIQLCWYDHNLKLMAMSNYLESVCICQQSKQIKASVTLVSNIIPWWKKYFKRIRCIISPMSFCHIFSPFYSFALDLYFESVTSLRRQNILLVSLEVPTINISDRFEFSWNRN